MAVLHVAAVNLKFDAASTDICILAPPSSTRLLKASNAVNTISRASPAVHDDRPLPAAVNDFAAGGPKLTEILNGLRLFSPPTFTHVWSVQSRQVRGVVFVAQ